MDYHFKKGLFNEEELEKAIISLFQEQGYSYACGENLPRKYSEVLLENDLRSYLESRYHKENLTENELKVIISQLTHISSAPLYAGARETYWLMTEGFLLQRDDPNKLALHVDFLYFEQNDVEKNHFKVINQLTVQGVGDHNRRPDLLLYINGIPLCIFEFKSAIRENTTIYSAWEQIHHRYKRDIPNLMKYCLLSVVSDGANTRLGTIFTPYEYYYSWNKINEEEKVSNGIASLLPMLKGAFAKERIVGILRDFLYFPDNSGSKELAVVTRYPQFFGSHKMFDNIKEHLKPEGDGKGGTYFGATGCGKTYTMLFLARLLMLREKEHFHNPTVIILIDREELDTQTAQLFEVSKRFLRDTNVRSIENRNDMTKTLKDIASGGVFITTIQKFCEATGLLSDRSNIICISDEAHRTQTNTAGKLKYTSKGVETTYGFAKYLRDSLPNATYCGFTGTPVDETLAVFGPVVDKYTMKEAVDDGITVRITYEPRLARVIVSEKQAKEIQEYYEECAKEGANEEHIEASKRAMTKLEAVLINPDRLKKLAKDIVAHYKEKCELKPKIVQKAMIVCATRNHAYALLKEIIAIEPEWNVAKKSERLDELSQEEQEQLQSLEKIKLVATEGIDDASDLHKICGNKKYRSMLDKQFKNDNSNFQIAIVVDMWITGFDVPSLSAMYIDKPLKKHTLIQTISRVNRVFEGKEKGLVVDYIGIKNDMMEAVKRYGDTDDSPIDELSITLSIVQNHLSLIDDLLHEFDATDFFSGSPEKRLLCLNDAAEFVQVSKEREKSFMTLSRKLKGAYEICAPSGDLTVVEVTKSQFYLAIRSIIYKQTKENAPDIETMNRTVESMVQRAMSCTGVENIIDINKTEDMFSEEFLEELNKVNLPITKFNALLKLLKRAILGYGLTNKVKAQEFQTRLKAVVELYNDRDKFVFTSQVVDDFVNDLSEKLLEILKDLDIDKSSFEKMGISYEEKAFYDILIQVRDTHKFKYDDEKCLKLAKEIKILVDDKAQFADWASRNDVKNQLNRDLTILLYKNGYPPEWDEEIFEKVLEQAENFKKYSEN